MTKQEVNEIGQFIPLHYHFQMLSDPHRMTAFRSAIEKLVRPNHRVADLGSGTGVLSFFAAKQGAKVYGVEFNPALVLASRRFLEENQVSHLVEIFEGDASNWLPPEPVDFVICEMLHSALLREKQLQVVSTFRDAHFKYFGKKPKIIPNATLLAVQPVWQEYCFQGYHASVPLFQYPYATDNGCVPFGDPQVYKILDYDNANVETFIGNVTFEINQDSNVNALRFITKSLLSIDIYSGENIDWHNQYLVIPLEKSLRLLPGQTIRVKFCYNPGEPIELLSNSIYVEVINLGNEGGASILDYNETAPECVPVINLDEAKAK